MTGFSLSEDRFGVWLHGQRVGTINRRGDYTRFYFAESYLDDPGRPVLGLQFEQHLRSTEAATLRLPPWFSNLLPEGLLRRWIADERGASPDREMELLAQVGHDLPGAVTVLPVAEEGESESWATALDRYLHPAPPASKVSDWRFSLAGVSLKFSMLERYDGQLTLPAVNEGSGDWIVKLPYSSLRAVPHNEAAMMRLAAAAGIDVPEVRLVHRDDLPQLPAEAWPEGELWALAIKRFDRDEVRSPVHIEDLAQVRNYYADDKYSGSYETVAGLIYRDRYPAQLEEFARRLAFCVLIANGDAHLKNWSVIYRNRKVAALAPAYDLVSTSCYRDQAFGPERMALHLSASRLFANVSIGTFSALERRLGAQESDLAGCVEEMVNLAVAAWPELRDWLRSQGLDRLATDIDKEIGVRSRTILRPGRRA